jgi:S-adenosylmethionine:tRNA ribosyltransferase-isomerase
MRLSLADFDYDLPAGLIAQHPAERRDQARLMVVDRESGRIEHARFADIGQWLPHGSLLAVNDARVVPVRVVGRKESGGRVEAVILEPPGPESGPGAYELDALVKAGRLRIGARLDFEGGLTAEVLETGEFGRARLCFRFPGPPAEVFEAVGRMPLPPYIKREGGSEADAALDRERYQTVYARSFGAVAAPTAGLHFTPELLESLKRQGHETAVLTLLVGYGTFAPVREEDPTRHRLHPERMALGPDAAGRINQARAAGRKVVAVGTTDVRSLEFAAGLGLPLRPYEGWCDLFIHPGYEFRVVDHMVTNFHLPKSSLLMLVAAFAGLELIREAYRTAVAEGYRFFSYGDAMLIL